jgi:hypothetical protein
VWQTSRVPSLDNGEWVWALKATVEALEQREQPTLAKRYSVLLSRVIGLCGADCEDH